MPILLCIKCPGTKFERKNITALSGATCHVTFELVCVSVARTAICVYVFTHFISCATYTVVLHREKLMQRISLFFTGLVLPVSMMESLYLSSLPIDSTLWQLLQHQIKIFQHRISV